MSANLPRRRRAAGDQELAQRRDASEARLWQIRAALAVSFTVAVLGLAALASLAWVLLGLAGFRRHGALSLPDTVGVLQLVFVSVAGAGALVALIVAYRQLVAFRRQKIAGSAHDRTRVFNERFTAIAAQLGDGRPAVRLAGVHAMAGLADDWAANRQTCIDVLCAYLRMPYEPDPGPYAPAAQRLAFRGSREVRHTVIRVITAHLREDAAVPWNDRAFDFTGVVFDGGDFTGAQFSGGTVSFSRAEFSGGEVGFNRAKFSGGTVTFSHVKFSGGTVDFSDAKFSGGEVDFHFAGFSGGRVAFTSAEFSGGRVAFPGAEFSGGRVAFPAAKFSGGRVAFSDAKFSGGTVDFYFAEFSGGRVDFDFAEFSGGTVDFDFAEFSGGRVAFPAAKFSGGTVDFPATEFSGGTVGFTSAEFSGGTVGFRSAEFSGGRVDFSDAADWSHPPGFGWDSPPSGVKLPAAAHGGSQ